MASRAKKKRMMPERMAFQKIETNMSIARIQKEIAQETAYHLSIGLARCCIGKEQVMSPQMMGPAMRQPCSYSLEPPILCVLSLCMALPLLRSFS